MITIPELVLLFAAAVAAGGVNAIAGGGTLISFPVLTAVGISTVSSNITSTVALSPGYLGGAIAQIKDLKDQKSRVKLLIPAGVIGGVIGGILLLNSGEKLFRELVPYLILLACLLLAIQEPVRKWLKNEKKNKEHSEAWSFFPVLIASVYGGYFGAGVSVIILAVLGLTINDDLIRLNALKQIISFSINITAAIFFLFSGHVVWLAALVMAVGSVLGGIFGGKLAGRLKPNYLRIIVIVIGVVVAIIYFVR